MLTLNASGCGTTLAVSQYPEMAVIGSMMKTKAPNLCCFAFSSKSIYEICLLFYNPPPSCSTNPYKRGEKWVWIWLGNTAYLHLLFKNA